MRRATFARRILNTIENFLRLALCLLLLAFQTNSLSAQNKVVKNDRANASPTTARLVVSANIFSGDQDELRDPVRAEFYLLRESAATIFRRSKFYPNGGRGETLEGETAYLEAYARAVAEGDDDSAVMAFLLRDSLEKNRIAALQTNWTGTGRLKGLSPGDYYLFGAATKFSFGTCRSEFARAKTISKSINTTAMRLSAAMNNRAVRLH